MSSSAFDCEQKDWEKGVIMIIMRRSSDSFDRLIAVQYNEVG